MKQLAIIDKSETTEGVVTVYENGMVISHIREGAYIDVPYLVRGKERLLSLGLNKKFYVLNESDGFYRVSKQARELSASREYAEHIAAVAVLTNHISVKLILELYLKIDKPVNPTRAFTDRNQALRWLEERRAYDQSLQVMRVA